MHYRLLAVALLVAGCEPDPAPYKYIHRCMVVHSDVELDSGLFDHIEKAESMYADLFGEDVCLLMSSRYIRVLDSLAFDCGIATRSGKCGGLTTATGDIYLAKDLSVLMHELLHVRDIDRGDLDTAWHGGWGVDGHWDADSQYREWSNSR